MIESAFKNINTSMGTIQMPEPKATRRPTRRTANRPYYSDAPNNPFIGR